MLKDHFFRLLALRKEQRLFSRSPVLVGGAPRSGTTWLLAILAAHPHLWAVPYETNAFRTWEGGVPGKRYRIYKELWKAQVPASAHRWCEKTPCHVRFLPQIHDYFAGKYRFIHIIRDGRDVITSRLPGQEGRYFVSPEQWMQDVRAGLQHEQQPQVMNLKYEELVTQHEPSLRKICDFLDEPFLPEFQHWHQHSPKRTDKAWASSLQQKYTDSVGRWRQPQHEDRIREAMKVPGFKELLARLAYLQEN
jgi:hypothetical protein